ncbi:tetracycline resistance efflux pump [Alteribacillus persepolensis]|uniref:Tetracycline resistance efflux pump n=1 Tax=Alteribacillus persepolensis TaxID=568899 RepID=A0A1G8FI38_9BACI|nr:Na+/H+ antiporter NhaC family protein [Alteribacillus persepolensis]SDH81814.1 tetracycline resistance efflux pump [Alteribacillus persepolensis]
MNEPSVWSLLPPILALVMIIATRKVLPSLGAGIIIGALILTDWSFSESAALIWEIFAGIFVVEGALNDWELYIIFFLLILGVMAALISFSGGSRAFGEWALTRVKTRVGAQLATLLFGILVFIDDYFNSLTVGQVSRPVTDRQRISRAKLAYIVDSVAAPICVIAPLSSWGAYIITIIADILKTHGLTQLGGLQAFLYMVPMNFYAVTALMFVFLVIIWKLDFGPMRTHEQRAVTKHQLLDPNRSGVPGEQSKSLPTHNGKVRDLVLPILVLIVSTVFFMIITGVHAADEVTALSVFAETDVASSLVYGGLIGLLVTILLTITKQPSATNFTKTIGAGIQSMLPAIYILILAWIIVSIIDQLGTGTYLATFIDGTIPLFLLPALLFILAGFMAFSTGTSWGTFSILLPIAGEIAATLDISLMLPMLAAVLAGSILGDHCSPISDTTILSSTGAGSHHIDHVITQLPYALLSGIGALIGFLLLGATGSTLLGLMTAVIITLVIALIVKARIQPIGE